MITRVVVIGFGNPLRRDDGVGWRVADMVAERWSEQVTVLTGQQPLPEWSATLAEADVAFFIDAGLTAPDRLRLQPLAVPAPASAALEGHALSAQQVLGLASVLYGQAPLAYLLQLPVDDVGFGETLSPRTAHAATRAVQLLNKRLASLP